LVNDFLEYLQKEGFMVNGCADDMAILVSGNLLNSLGINALKIVGDGVRPMSNDKYVED
jgi:hypothetical protein